jgi:sigma-B regulation protein RsbU (phosphoserine phosphatase)
MFVTAFYCVLDTSNGRVSYCNAGHNPPFIVTENGASMLQPVRGLGLCLTRDYQYEPGSFKLTPGESVLLYTDGVTEAMNRERHLFEEHRLEKVLSEAVGNSAQQIVESTIEAVADFTAGENQKDDITTLSVVFHGP